MTLTAAHIAQAFDRFEEMETAEDPDAAFDALTKSAGLHDVVDELFGERCGEFFPPEGNPKFENRYVPEAWKAYTRPACRGLLVGLLAHRAAKGEDESPPLDPQALGAALDSYRDFLDSQSDVDYEGLGELWQSLGLSEEAMREFTRRQERYLAPFAGKAVCMMGLVVALQTRQDTVRTP